jgi:hypothetical protein
LLADQEAQAEVDQQAEEFYEAQEALRAGDPEAVERLHELNMAGLEERLAPLEAWQRGYEQQQALAAGQAEADELIAGHIERLGVEGVTRDAVWARANQLLTEAQQEAATLPPEQQAVFYSAEAGRLAIQLGAEDAAYYARPLGNVPNAVTNRLFGPPPSSRPRSLGLGNVPNAVTRWMFG